MEHIKIQINSGEALHKLIGDSPEMRLEFKDRIVQALIKDHITPLIGPDNYNAIMCEVRVEVDKLKAKYVSETIVSPATWNSTIKLTPDIQKLITDRMNEQLNAEVKTLVQAQIAAINTKLESVLKANKGAIERYITNKIDEVIGEQVKAQLQEITTHINDLSKHYVLEKQKNKSAADGSRKIELEL